MILNTLKTKLIGIIIAAVIGRGALWAVSPYFTNTTIDEALPASSIPKEQMMSLSASFVGVDDGIHDAAGHAMILSADGKRYLRFEDFSATNGPDLYVYLSTDEKATEFVNLGRLKANNGNQNYEVPSDVDISKYSKVLIWCKSFSVLFGSADLV